VHRRGRATTFQTQQHLGITQISGVVTSSNCSSSGGRCCNLLAITTAAVVHASSRRESVILLQLRTKLAHLRTRSLCLLFVTCHFLLELLLQLLQSSSNCCSSAPWLPCNVANNQPLLQCTCSIEQTHVIQGLLLLLLLGRAGS
jgi:hypothetical protein